MEKRANIKRPSWDEFFMFSALWAATRSSCLYLANGSVIVKDKRIIASGYNGAPPDIPSCLEQGCRKDEYKVEFDDKGKGVCRGIHAEMNAKDQIAREDLKGTSIYSLYYPCSSCAKEIVGSGIREVVYSFIYSEPDSLTLEQFSQAGIKLRRMSLNLDNYFNMAQQVYKKEYQK